MDLRCHVSCVNLGPGRIEMVYRGQSVRADNPLEASKTGTRDEISMRHAVVHDTGAPSCESSGAKSEFVGVSWN